MNLFLFRKYWSKHKGRLFSLILSIILFTGTAVFSVLNERTELCRQLHEMYDNYGNYAFAIRNVTEEQGQKMEDLPYIDRIGIISAVGTTNIGGKNYTIGSFENDEAETSLHFHLNEGYLPHKTGQVAMPEFILEQLYVDAELGDNITLEFEDLNKNKSSVTYELSGIIGGNTYRTDMEYTSRNNGITVTSNEVEYPTPSIYVYSEDTDGLTKYYNYLISPTDETYFSEEETEHFNKTAEDLWTITNNVTSGWQKMILDSMSGTDDNQNVITTETSDNIKLIRIITFFMVIVAAISMFSGVISIMPQRIDSLRLLRSIGMSKKKLLSVFLTEFLIFWIMGNVLGIVLGCGVHELLIFLQKLIGIPAYRGYFVEYIVSQKSASPFLLPLILSLVIAAASLIVPVKSIITMTFYKKPSGIRSRRKVSSLKGVFSKMTGTHAFSMLSCLSMVTVICSTVFGYCYYTGSGKGTTCFSVGNNNTSASYYLAEGIDLKKNDIDCAISAHIPLSSSLAVYDREYGISASEMQDLGMSAELFSWGSYPSFTVVYDENMEAPQQLSKSVVALNEGWEYYEDFKGNTVYNLPLIFINDNMMEMLCGASSDDVILVGHDNRFAYEIGDTVPMITCLSDENKHVRLDTMKHINVKITKQLNLKNVSIEENDILNNCGVFHFPDSYAIAMTAETAEKYGFYYPDYSSVMIRFNENMSDVEIKSYVSSAVNKPVRTITIYELEHHAKMNMLASNANSVVLFVLLFVLCMISVWNLLRMNAENNFEQFRTIHSIGLSKEKIKKMFVGSMMRSVVIAVIVGMVISFSGKIFLETKYNEYYSLLTKQQELNGNTDFPDVIFGVSLSSLDETDPIYELTARMEELKDVFFLEKEMWLPELLIPLCIICAVIIISTLLCSLSVAKKIKFERRRSDDQDR